MITISQDLLIDTALNVSGYVAAGALWLVLSSLFQRSTRRAASGAPAEIHTESKVAAVHQDAIVEKRRLEFVDLKGSESTSGRISLAAEAAGRESGNYRRNRVEVMRMAREMLEAGSSRDRIKQTLPISEGELAMLTRD